MAGPNYVILSKKFFEEETWFTKRRQHIRKHRGYWAAVRRYRFHRTDMVGLKILFLDFSHPKNFCIPPPQRLHSFQLFSPCVKDHMLFLFEKVVTSQFKTNR